jgi:hypothetical protein
VLECNIRQADKTVARLNEIMRTPPNWADGIPLDVETKIMQRYGK